MKNIDPARSGLRRDRALGSGFFQPQASFFPGNGFGSCLVGVVGVLNRKFFEGAFSCGEGTQSNHRWKCGNAVGIGDGCATVSGNKPPGRTRQPLDERLGRRGRGSRPGVRISRQRCSSGSGLAPEPLRRKAKDEASPFAPVCPNGNIPECLTPSFPVLPVDWRHFAFRMQDALRSLGLVSIDTP